MSHFLSRTSLLALLSLGLSACPVPPPDTLPDAGPDAGEAPGTFALTVAPTFPAGTVLRDHGTTSTYTVDAQGVVRVRPGADGLVLLERQGAAATPFTWKNATVYFAVTDRFFNGDTSNDTSYGRVKGGPTDIGGWHGGDLPGLTAKLDHLASLGATAVWVTPVVEQVHGWVGGGSGDFQHWGYHGYWALDFTTLDKNLGTEAQLEAFVAAAHARGIRVVVDVVLNHPGYATGADLAQYLPQVFKDGTGAAFRAFTPGPGQSWHAWNDLVNYQDLTWSQRWWGPQWVRAGIRDYPMPGMDEISKSLNFLPDFRTDRMEPAALPPLLANKSDTRATVLPGARVRDSLIAWQVQWIRRFGFDGLRCDTAKHVELDVWNALKEAGTQARRDWQAANPGKGLPGDFWMVGEVFPHGVERTPYFYLGGFDSIINFDFQRSLRQTLEGSKTLLSEATALEALYAGMASKLRGPTPFDVMSYLSSHDTALFFHEMGNDVAKQRQGGTALLLAPGSVQVFYGDETGRRFGPTGSDALQGTRSDMNWDSIDTGLLAHWQRLGTFRQRHAAVGAGRHQRLDSAPGTYAFARTFSEAGVEDAAVVLLAPPP